MPDVYGYAIDKELLSRPKFLARRFAAQVSKGER
jgi:hypothetical protein